MRDKSADGVAGIDADDVGADAVGDRARGRRIGADQRGRGGYHVDAVGTGGRPAQRAGRARVEDERPVVGRALRRQGAERDAGLEAGVLGEIPARLTGDVRDGVQGLDDGARAAAAVVQHAAAVAEGTVGGGHLDRGRAAETVADRRAGAVQGERAARTEVGGDEAELAGRLVQDHGVAQDGQRSEKRSGAVTGQGPVAGSDLGDAKLAGGVVAGEGAGEGAADGVARDQGGARRGVEVLDHRGRHARHGAQGDVRGAAEVEDGASTRETDRGVCIDGAGRIDRGAKNKISSVDVHGQRLAAEAAQLEDSRPLLVDGAAGGDVGIDRESDLFVGMSGRALDGREAAGHLGDGHRGGGRQAETSAEARDHPDVVQRAGIDGVCRVREREDPLAGGDGRTAGNAAL